MRNNWSRFYLSGILVLLLALSTTVVHAAIELPAGKEVQVVFEQDVSSKYVTPGQLIPIRLSGAVEIGGVAVVKDGAKGTARVKSVKPAGRAGKPGQLEVVLVELEPNGAYKAEGDAKIQLAAITGDDSGTIRASGKGRKTLSYLFIFGLFIKGTEAVIPADKPFKARVTEDIRILVE
jgi:hypothetical protein